LSIVYRLARTQRVGGGVPWALASSVGSHPHTVHP
jgi:hypothetical protein